MLPLLKSNKRSCSFSWTSSWRFLAVRVLPIRRSHYQVLLLLLFTILNQNVWVCVYLLMLINNGQMGRHTAFSLTIFFLLILPLSSEPCLFFFALLFWFLRVMLLRGSPTSPVSISCWIAIDKVAGQWCCCCCCCRCCFCFKMVSVLAFQYWSRRRRCHVIGEVKWGEWRECKVRVLLLF